MMKLAKVFSVLAIGGAALCVLGCQKESRVDASRSLEQSFQESEPEVKQAIATATTSLKVENYTDAARALNPVLAGRELTPPQRQAAGLLFQQINQALAKNPGLDSKKLYELRVKLHQAAAGAKRF